MAIRTDEISLYPGLERMREQFSDDKNCPLLAETLKMLEERNQHWLSILLANDFLEGVELKKLTDDMYAVILKEPNSEGKYRALYYGPIGFTGHEVREGPLEVLKELLSQGYVEQVDGAMDRLSQTLEWRRGMIWTHLMQEHNQGNLSYREMLERYQLESKAVT